MWLELDHRLPPDIKYNCDPINFSYSFKFCQSRFLENYFSATRKPPIPKRGLSVQQPIQETTLPPAAKIQEHTEQQPLHRPLSQPPVLKPCKCIWKTFAFCCLLACGYKWMDSNYTCRYNWNCTWSITHFHFRFVSYSMHIMVQLSTIMLFLWRKLAKIACLLLCQISATSPRKPRTPLEPANSSLEETNRDSGLWTGSGSAYDEVESWRAHLPSGQYMLAQIPQACLRRYSGIICRNCI